MIDGAADGRPRFVRTMLEDADWAVVSTQLLRHLIGVANEF